MASQVTPTGQQQHLNPYGGRLFDFDTTDSRVYLTRAINTLYNAVGSNCILEGIQITNLNYDAGSDTVGMTVQSGKVIIDSTLIDFPDSTELSLDTSGLDDSGNLVISLGFSYVPTIYANRAVMKLLYVSEDGTQVLPGDWFQNYDRIILAIFDFNKTAKTVTNQTWNTAIEYRDINILGQTYEINPMDNFTSRVRDVLIRPQFVI
ncbi:MAG: hypothetical protein H8D97_00680 [Proteobacteria bacterium]|nr:hypothetical protein [Pseudomonadota bacterium]